MEAVKSTGSHSLTLQNRTHGIITGVQDIHSFNENEILMITEAGRMLIRGEQLHVKGLNLEKGEAELEGRVGSIAYLGKNTQKKNESWMKRILR